MTEDDPQSDDRPWDLSKEQLAAVGRIAVGAAWLEEEIADLCNLLLGSDSRRGDAVTHGMSAAYLIDLARRLLAVSKASDELKKELTGLLHEAGLAFRKRHRIVHGLVLGDSENRVQVGSRKARAQRSQETVESLDAIGFELEDIGYRIFNAADGVVLLNLDLKRE